MLCVPGENGEVSNQIEEVWVEISRGGAYLVNIHGLLRLFRVFRWLRSELQISAQFSG